MSEWGTSGTEIELVDELDRVFTTAGGLPTVVAHGQRAGADFASVAAFLRRQGRVDLRPTRAAVGYRSTESESTTTWL